MRTALTPLNFSQMSLPGPLVYFSYSSQFSGEDVEPVLEGDHDTASLFYLPVQTAALFPRNAEIPSWASTAMEFIDMISLAYAYAFGWSRSICE